MRTWEVTSLDLSMEKAADIVPLLEEKFLNKTSTEWIKLFAKLDIVCGRLNHFRDVLTDEQLGRMTICRNITALMVRNVSFLPALCVSVRAVISKW